MNAVLLWTIITLALAAIAIVLFPLLLFKPSISTHNCQNVCSHTQSGRLSDSLTPKWWMNLCAMHVPSDILADDVKSDSPQTLIAFTAKRIGTKIDTLGINEYQFFKQVPTTSQFAKISEPVKIHIPGFSKSINDVRLFLHKNRLFAVTSSCVEDCSQEAPHIVEFDKQLSASLPRRVSFDHPNKRDKNWCPLLPFRQMFFTEHQNGELVFRCIDGIETESPAEVLTKQIRIPFVYSLPKDTSLFSKECSYTMRGSTPWIEVRSGVYWGFLHIAEKMKRNLPAQISDFVIGISSVSTYRHFFFEIDLINKEVLRYSNVICFDRVSHHGCQFAVGFYPSDTDTFILSGGVNDRHNFMQTYCRNELDALLVHKPLVDKIHS